VRPGVGDPARRHEDRGAEAIPQQHRERRAVEVRETIVEGDHHRALGQSAQLTGQG